MTVIFRIFFYLIGFGLTISGGVSCIAYLNIIVAGKSFSDYLSFIAKRTECHLLIIGLFIIWASVLYPFSKSEEKRC
ncbi:hypothetical protein [Bacillus sp. FJAT-47783]|uniref:hypothetical protein n=1 Tax=Bacillus sp. FJAT-47783 TaxID=2922712 RepID=UPI002435D2AC|nr:hypothetical protein [Bacillus sp. FJAT-47783]